MSSLIPFTRSSSIPHSKWQSAVQKTIHELFSKEEAPVDYTDEKVKFHPMMLGANLHVDAHNNNDVIPAVGKDSLAGSLVADIDKDPITQSFLSQEPA